MGKPALPTQIKFNAKMATAIGRTQKSGGIGRVVDDSVTDRLKMALRFKVRKYIIYL